MRKRRCGFTIVEIVITLAIIVIVVAIASPYFVEYRRTSLAGACVDNLKKLEAAMTLAKLHGIDNPVASDIANGSGAGYLRSMPSCPANKSIYTTLDPPQCPNLLAGHALPTN